MSFLNVPQFFSILLHVGCFQILAVMNNAAKKHLCRFFCGLKHFQFIGVNTTENDCWVVFVRMCLVLEETDKPSFKVAVLFCIPTKE